MSIENILKQIWKRSPVCVRNLILSIMSSRIGTHDPKAPESPLYVLGAFASSSGLAEGARLYAAARRREGREVICLDITQAMRQRTDLKESLDGVVAFESRNMLSLLGTIVVHANPPQFQLVLLKLGSEFLRNKRI
ncbi:MAG: hypothetical protein Q4F72_09600, partial [Desulfovibrionaceae bacterium]|nr:hypothetical protein [Desulfovibrionaceae bacterium]